MSSALQALRDGAVVTRAGRAEWPKGASRGYRIGRVAVEPPVAMAPMADVTDACFHEVLREIGGPGLYTVEMISAQELATGSSRQRRLLRRPAGCPAFAVQVYGHEPEAMAEAARVAVDVGADVVDVNMGCPAKTVTGHACGSALLRDERLVGRLLRAVRAALPGEVPLTLKYRLGWDEARRNHLTIGRVAVDEGVAALTLHGRTRAQMYAGSADWAAVAELAAAVAVPVVGNGDILSVDDVTARLAEAGCAGVMIARAALANPWIFRQVRQRLAGEAVTLPAPSERMRVILDHHARLVDEHGEAASLHRIRTFVGYYTKGLERGIELRRRLSEARTGAAFRDLVTRVFEAWAALDAA